MFAFVFLLLLISVGYGFQSSQTEEGANLKWTIKSIPLRIVSNSKRISKSETERIISNSVSQWNSNLTTSKLSQTTTGNNQIRFESDFTEYGPAVIGITELKYGPTGVISGGIIRLNEDDYVIGTNETSSLSSEIFLGDIITHELGHFLGLAHSEVIDSSMFYSTFPGQNNLSEDDAAAARSKYGNNSGIIKGYVKGGNGVGVLGVHVQAISSSNGEVISTLSDENGYYQIEGLPLEASYYIYTSPAINLAALPRYFHDAQVDFCPSSYVGSFFSSCGKEFDGIPTRITLTTTNKIFDTGVISINCALRAQDNYNYEKVQNEPSRINIYNFSDEEVYEKSYVGYFRTSEVLMNSFSEEDKFEIDLRDFTINGEQKYLKIQIISQAFGNPIEYSMSVKMNGGAVQGSPFLKEILQLQTYKLDPIAFIPLSTNSLNNVFEINLSAKKLSEMDLEKSIPSSVLFSSEKHWPYLLMISIWDEGALSPILDTPSFQSDNLSCLDAPFTYGVEKSDYATTTSEVPGRRDDAPMVAGCGTIDPPSSGPTNYLIVVALGFLFSFSSSKLFKNKKKILS